MVTGIPKTDVTPPRTIDPAANPLDQVALLPMIFSLSSPSAATVLDITTGFSAKKAILIGFSDIEDDERKQSDSKL
jgi:hypothetical protein